MAPLHFLQASISLMFTASYNQLSTQRQFFMYHSKGWRSGETHNAAAVHDAEGVARADGVVRLDGRDGHLPGGGLPGPSGRLEVLLDLLRVRAAEDEDRIGRAHV